jgi:hypothetical protein
MNVAASAILYPGEYDTPVLPGFIIHEVGVVLNTFPLAPSSELRQLVADAAPGEEQQFIQLMFASQFAIRQLSNLGDGADANSLVDRLRKLKYDEEGDVTTLRDSQGLKVNVDSPQQRDGKKIAVDLLIEGQGSQLSIKNSGFGLFNRKLWPDIPKTAVALFLAIAGQHTGNRDFVRRVMLACGEVGRQWSQKNVTLTNHAQVALFTAMGVWSTSVAGEYTEDRPGL